MRIRDLTGQKFGRLTVVEQAGRTKYGNVLWKCKCDCGLQRFSQLKEEPKCQKKT